MYNKTVKPVIQLNNVTKMYGNSRGVLDLSLNIMPGTVFGFLGPNGAGKTTTISMLVDLIRPTKGTVKIFGMDSVKASVEIRQRLGFLAGDFALDKDLTGWQQLEYFANLRGQFSKKLVKDLAERLDCDLTRKFATLSRGNQQKLGLISALMHEPELLIFDEPTSGLDPLIQAEFNKIILDYRKHGRTVFISSHSLGEVQLLCDQIGFIREGRLIDVKTLEELLDVSTKYVRVNSNDKKLLSVLENLPNVKVEFKHTSVISLVLSGDVNPLLAILGRHKVKDLTISEPDLETVFLQYYQQDRHV